MSTQHTDRELLKLAAKAAGHKFTPSSGKGISSDGRSAWIKPGIYWQPFGDDGDALRLAAKLRIDIEWVEQPAGRTVEAYQRGEESFFCATEAEADYRRAIVRAAAAIGEAMP